MDVAVKSEAECHTDHQILCVKVRMTRRVYHRRIPPTRTRRFDVSRLAKSAEGDHSELTQRRLF